MIHGIGTDVVQMERIQKIFDRHGERFARHLLMPQELEKNMTRQDMADLVAYLKGM